MAIKRKQRKSPTAEPSQVTRNFRPAFLNEDQKIAWEMMQNHDITFLLGAAGTGKTFLSIAFALNEFFATKKRKIILTRPIVEAGEKLGFLPGGFTEKVEPYMMPLYDSIDKLVGTDKNFERTRVNTALEIAPLAYLRGRTLDNCVCILDEAQNCTKLQLKMFLTRIGEGSKMIINGDPTQSDLFAGLSGFLEVTKKLSCLDEIGVLRFDDSAIVRHPVLEKLIPLLD